MFVSFDFFFFFFGHKVILITVGQVYFHNILTCSSGYQLQLQQYVPINTDGQANVYNFLVTSALMGVYSSLFLLPVDRQMFTKAFVATNGHVFLSLYLITKDYI